VFDFRNTWGVEFCQIHGWLQALLTDLTLS
jgi:hypothetical protein